MTTEAKAKLIIQLLNPVAASAAALRPAEGSTAADIRAYWASLLREAVSLAELIEQMAPNLLQTALQPKQNQNNETTTKPQDPPALDRPQ